MRDLIHKFFLTGIGLASMTDEKIREYVADLEKKGEVNAQEGRELAKQMIDKAKSQTEHIRTVVQQECDKILGKFKLVSRKEYDELKQRVDKLEQDQGGCCSQDSL
jgi:polyhydroxyalkanoate synthesis regulator phasin